MTMKALDRKLWRDLWQLRSQSLAIVAVMASGVACFIMFMSTLDSLLESRDRYYQDYRFAEVFVLVDCVQVLKVTQFYHDCISRLVWSDQAGMFCIAHSGIAVRGLNSSLIRVGSASLIAC